MLYPITYDVPLVMTDLNIGRLGGGGAMRALVVFVVLWIVLGVVRKVRV